MGYRPNLAAQALKLNRHLSIAAILPRHISHFFDPVREGIRAAAHATVGMNIALEFQEYPRLDVGDTQAFEAALKKHYDGIIFIPGNTRKFDPLIRNLSRAGTAMMCVGSDAPNTDRIGSVAAHAAISGAMAAELLSYKLNRKANVAIFSGELSTLDHAEKLAAQPRHVGRNGLWRDWLRYHIRRNGLRLNRLRHDLGWNRLRLDELWQHRRLRLHFRVAGLLRSDLARCLAARSAYGAAPVYQRQLQNDPLKNHARDRHPGSLQTRAAAVGR